MQWPTPEELAREFHETYERLAPSFQYRTREDSAVPWADVPAKNQALMMAVATEILRVLRAGGKQPAPEHLQVTTSDRGFDRLPPIPSLYGGSVRVFESSLATQPAIWLTVEVPEDLNRPEGPMAKAPVHLSVESALKLADQLRFLVEHHYQCELL